MLPWYPAGFIDCCGLQDVVIAQKGMALIAAAANKVAAFPEVGTPLMLICKPVLVSAVRQIIYRWYTAEGHLWS